MKKKFTSYFSRVLCLMFMMGAVSVSCAESTEGPEEGEKIPVTASATYSFSLSKDYLNLVDATVTYWNDQGEQKTESLTSAIWSKSFAITRTQDVGYMVNAVPKSNIDELLTADSYKLGYSYGIGYVSSDGKGENHSSDITLTVPKAKVKEYLEKNAEVYKFSVKWNDEAKKFVTE